jgi:hypothetical protein
MYCWLDWVLSGRAAGRAMPYRVCGGPRRAGQRRGPRWGCGLGASCGPDSHLQGEPRTPLRRSRSCAPPLPPCRPRSAQQEAQRRAQGQDSVSSGTSSGSSGAATQPYPPPQPRNRPPPPLRAALNAASLARLGGPGPASEPSEALSGSADMYSYPPLLITRDGRMAPATSDGGMSSVLSGAAYSEVSRPLEPGEGGRVGGGAGGRALPPGLAPAAAAAVLSRGGDASGGASGASEGGGGADLSAYAARQRRWQEQAAVGGEGPVAEGRARARKGSRSVRELPFNVAPGMALQASEGASGDEGGWEEGEPGPVGQGGRRTRQLPSAPGLVATSLAAMQVGRAGRWVGRSELGTGQSPQELRTGGTPAA